MCRCVGDQLELCIFLGIDCGGEWVLCTVLWCTYGVQGESKCWVCTDGDVEYDQVEMLSMITKWMCCICTEWMLFMY